MTATKPPEVSVAEVREAISASLGDDRVANAEPDVLLLRRGLLTSIELVTLLVDLEARFGVAVPESVMAPDRLSLNALVTALGGKTGRATPPERRSVPRPLIALLTAAVAFFVIDRGVGAWVRGAGADAYRAFLEDGLRLYPVAGGYAQDDFRFATRHHRVRQAPSGPRVLMFGDSGTIGSYVRADQTIPAYAERSLAARVPGARVENLAWFGRLLVKDLMLLEAVWEEPFDAVVFTVGQDYFSKGKVQTWLSKYRHCSVNWPLFAGLTERLPEASRAPFERLRARLEAADRSHAGPRRRFLFRVLEVEHYRPFLTHLLVDRGLAGLGPFFSPYRHQLEVVGARRVLADRTPTLVKPGLRPEDVDRDQIDILIAVAELLSVRGTEVILYVEPTAPADWPRSLEEGRVTGRDLAQEVAARTHAQIVDTSWSLEAEAFLDSQAHYEPAANAQLGKRVGEALAAVLTSTRTRTR